MMARGKQILVRGFKSRAERLALEVRDNVGRKPWEACPARLVAEALGYPVWAMSKMVALLRSGVLSLSRDTEECALSLERLCVSGCGFHATVLDMDGHRLILYNCSNSPARQESDLMHEIAHVLLEHDGCYVDPRADFSLPAIDERMEAEARWLGAALQIPEKGLYAHARQGRDNAFIAEVYGASEPQVAFRRSVLGIDRRISRARGL